MRLRVRYAETDQMGVVHHANYLIWFEAARTEFIRELGFPYARIEEEGFLLPVLEVNCLYKQPARYDDLIEIRVFPTSLSGVRVSFAYQCKREDGAVIVEGETKHAWLNKAWRPVSIERELPDLYLKLKELLK
jgi:acyl-CoA thioester hydrolase